jgi:HSP20 family protein
MADIAVKKEFGNKPVIAPQPPFETRSTDPWRMMREMMNWDPFREMLPLTSSLATGFAPAFEVKETPDGYLFKADVPGVKESDLEVTLTGNRLTISGKREAERQEQKDQYYAYERSYGSFTRSFTLPDGIDTQSVHADLKDGVLSLLVKKTPEAQPKKIAVQTAAKKS